ncbi:MAG: Fic-DOC domain mobile mystery protein B [Sphingobacteriales bacterium]|jgi:Fic-DOC domain mobile mystery protein B
MGLNLNYSEGQTPINEDENDGLKIKSLTTQKELDEFEQLNIEKAVGWTLSNKFTTEKILNEKFIKNLHKRMYNDVWRWAGEFRQSDKNIGINWTLIGIELKILLDDTKFWIANQTHSPDEIAIRFKHRLVAIHCFPNGNGRHSRLMADIIIENIFNKEFFSWNGSNMVNANEIRRNYINSLHEADKGNIQPLINFARE